jgi:lipopolysaccharide export system permease protein
MEEKRGNRKARRNPEYPHQVTKFDKQTLLIDLKGFDFTRTDESLFSDNYQMLNIAQLKQNEDSLVTDYNKSIKKFSDRVSKNFYVSSSIVQRIQDTRKKERDNKKEDTISPPPANKKKSKINRKPIQSESFKPSDTNQRTYKKDTLVKDTLINKDSTEADTTTLPAEPQGPVKLDIRGAFDTLNPYAKIETLGRSLNYARRNNKQISNSKSRFEHKRTNIYKHQIEWHKKFTLSFACIIFFFIGAPLGSIIRKGGLGTPLVISVILFIIYYIISMTGENFAEKGVLPAYIGMWVSSFIFLPIGIFLTYKATNDSVMFNTNTYIKAIQKVFRFRFKSDKQKKNNPNEES